MSHSFSESDIVSLLVGPNEFRFRIHKELLLMSGSRFFTACLSNDFSESETNTIRLPEDEVLPVRVFVEWLYHGRFASAQFAEASGKQNANIFVFAEKVCAEGYCNDLVDAFQQTYKERKLWMIPEQLVWLAQKGLRHHGIYRFGVKVYVYFLMVSAKELAVSDGFKRDLEGFGSDTNITSDVIMEILEYNQRPFKDPQTLKGCRYHQHKEGSVCSAVKK